MTSEVMDWDSAYRGDGVFGGPPPWNIGEPQPELAALHRAGRFRSAVLDAGCGHAELSLALAADGYTVVGIDISPTAIAAANNAAQVRNLVTASFAQADITALSGYDGRFSTVLDSTLFHSLPIGVRDGYLRSIHRAASPGAKLFILAFAKGAFPAHLETKPREVEEAELRDAVSRHWTVDDILPAFIHANALAMPGIPADAPYDRDEKGRLKFPAFLLTAHKSE
ncbi:class I SAM-dependent methyltransferase [Mycolicibacterium baixiangningiae]|uniref:class I SAM-dependent methyltransferase n=1 Tax=Mycolicibacterium baixiangningiae TaxID=2761578 RepID=UPI00186845EE|nr:class I SAM-dependent methyltransferase [Mycolicibacterium baixiangningiae]